MIRPKTTKSKEELIRLKNTKPKEELVRPESIKSKEATSEAGLSTIRLSLQVSQTNLDQKFDLFSQPYSCLVDSGADLNYMS